MRLGHNEYRINYALLAPALALLVIGLMFVYSASSGYSHNFFPRQLLWVSAGLACAIVTALLNSRVYRSYAAPIFLAALTALLLVLIFGEEVHGARSWIGAGSVRIQPSEFSKIALILIFGRYLSEFEEHRYDARYYAMSFALLFLPLALILLQPDLGTAVILVPIVLVMFYVSGTRQSLLALTFLAGVACLPLVWALLKPYQKIRFLITWHPETQASKFGYQAIQSKIAVGSGLLAGRGYLHSLQSQLKFLPERHTDFVYSVIGEEWGFAGCVTVLALYLVMILSGLYIARQAKSVFGEVVAVGITALFATHVFMNIGMAIGLMPIIGIPLPLLSYGGSAMLTALIALGLLQSIYAYDT